MGLIALFSHQETPMFIPGTKMELFNRLDVRYGYIAVEFMEQVLVSSLQEGKAVLQSLLDNGYLSPSDMAEIIAAMEQHGLRPIPQDVYQAIAAHPENSESLYWARTPVTNLAILHAHIAHVGKKHTKVVTTLGTALGYVVNCVINGEMTTDDAIEVMQQLIRAELPASDTDWTARFTALSDKDQLATYRKFPAHDVFEVMFNPNKNYANTPE